MLVRNRRLRIAVIFAICVGVIWCFDIFELQRRIFQGLNETVSVETKVKITNKKEQSEQMFADEGDDNATSSMVSSPTDQKDDTIPAHAATMLPKEEQPATVSPGKGGDNTTISMVSSALSAEDQAFLREYYQIVYNQTTPRENPTKPYADTLCLEVYCADLGDGGLSNTIFRLFGLMMIAYRDNACMCVPGVMPGHPRTTRDKSRKSPLTDYLDITQDPENWIAAGLPPVSTNNVTRILDDTWGFRDKFMDVMERGALKNIDLPSHPVYESFHRMLFQHPSPMIVATLKENNIPSKYIAIHARVEYDFRNVLRSRIWKQYGHNVTDILNIVSTGLKQLDNLDEEAYKHVIIAVSKENVFWKKDMLDVLERNETHWGATLQLINKPKKMSYFGMSLIDMLVCLKGTYFAGHSWSTFTLTANFARMNPFTTFDYAPGKLMRNDDKHTGNIGISCIKEGNKACVEAGT